MSGITNIQPDVRLGVMLKNADVCAGTYRRGVSK